MKKTLCMVAVLLMVTVLWTATPAQALCKGEDSRPAIQWLWEGYHATMINAILITENDAIVRHHEKFVQLAKEYSDRDPLLKVYDVREKGDDSIKDAFLTGMKANNLIYLIHVSDDNPKARELAIKELRLLSSILHEQTAIMREFPYWADLLEEGRYPSKRLSHIYVHYTIDIAEYYSDRMGINKRFYFWLGYLINDFTVANMTGNKEWIAEDQKYMEQLYSVRHHEHIPRFTVSRWDHFNTSDLTLKESLNNSQKDLDYIKTKYTDRLMK